MGFFGGIFGALLCAHFLLFFLYWIRVLLYSEVFKCGQVKEEPEKDFHESDLEYEDKE